VPEIAAKSADEKNLPMPLSPTPLYTARQVRELDRLAIEERGIAGIRLMKRAGRATLKALLARWPRPSTLTLYCGAGNNGGDGYIVAALARAAGIPVSVVAVAPLTKLAGDARLAYDFALREGVTVVGLAEAAPPAEGVIVDALLGTGLAGDVRGDFALAIAQINASGLPVVAVDIPSGLCADTGKVLGDAVLADVTVSFIGLKRGLFTGRGPVFSGQLIFDDLAVPGDIYPRVEAGVVRCDWPSLHRALPRRPADAHKGLFGHVMVVDGDTGFGGAAAMAAEAALKTGAGLVSVATRAGHVPAIIARCPEVMAVAVASGQQLEVLLDRPSVLVVGPGLGTSPWSEQLLQKALATGLPLVVDADALNILAAGRVGKDADLSRAVLTPHPGEAARLLGCTAADIQADRFAAVGALAAKYRATVLLKGAGTLIASGDGDIALCPYGNPGMATGGMGDILSGVIGALLGQGLSPRAAAETGACLHALAGDDGAAQHGQIGLCASDLLPLLRRRLNGG